MKTFRIENMKGGWFIGDFLPVAYKTSQFEVGTKLHKKGEKWPMHYHKLGTEITFLVNGEMIIQDKVLKSGDIFIVEPMEIVNPTFTEDCFVIVIKVPSIPGDKYCVNMSTTSA